MKTLIAIPCMDQVAAGFCGSLATLAKVGECTVSMLCGSLIYDSRNNLCKQALQIDADYVLFLDSDMVFEPDLLERMMKHMEDGKDIVTGLYFRRGSPFTPVIFKEFIPGEGKDETVVKGYEDYPAGEIFEVAACGGGALMISKKVLVDVALNYHTWFDPIFHAGEDMSFCWRARELGYKIWCDSTIPLGHVGQMIVTEAIYHATRDKEAKKNAEN